MTAPRPDTSVPETLSFSTQEPFRERGYLRFLAELEDAEDLIADLSHALDEV